MNQDTKQQPTNRAEKSQEQSGYVVTAPYITLRVQDDVTGTEVLTGFYAGGVVPDSVNADDLDRHLRKGMVAEQGSKEAERATPFGQPVQFDERGMPKSEAQIAADEQRQADRKPHGNASRDVWAAHATSKGAPVEETRPVEAGGLSRDDLKSKYGN